MGYQSTKIIELGSCAFRQWKADSHCKFIHGYRLIAKFWFGATELDHRNWVVDFGGLKGLKDILEKQFDHTFCVAGDDPLLAYFKELHDHGAVDLRIMPEGVGIEKTAEWCYKAAKQYIHDLTNGRCCVERVEVWEHEKNSAIYSVEKAGCCKSKNIPNVVSEVATVVAAPAEAIVQPVTPTNTVNAGINTEPRPAQVGNNVTSGWGNPFGGTSWGS